VRSWVGTGAGLFGDDGGAGIDGRALQQESPRCEEYQEDGGDAVHVIVGEQPGLRFECAGQIRRECREELCVTR
jgi:hypothetical protein